MTSPTKWEVRAEAIVRPCGCTVVDDSRGRREKKCKEHRSTTK